MCESMNANWPGTPSNGGGVEVPAGGVGEACCEDAVELDDGEEVLDSGAMVEDVPALNDVKGRAERR